jgi:hypothetical protein
VAQNQFVYVQRRLGRSPRRLLVSATVIVSDCQPGPRELERETVCALKHSSKDAGESVLAVLNDRWDRIATHP